MVHFFNFLLGFLTGILNYSLNLMTLGERSGTREEKGDEGKLKQDPIFFVILRSSTHHHLNNFTSQYYFYLCHSQKWILWY